MSDQIEDLLSRIQEGDEKARDEFFVRVRSELHEIAEKAVRKEPRSPTLQPTALVHEAYVRLVKESNLDWRTKSHFFALSARLIRNLLVDHARRRAVARKALSDIRLRGGANPAFEADVDVLALDEALDRLGRMNGRHARVVELRYFGGLSVSETAAALGVSDRTVKSDWRLCCSWLKNQLS